MRIRVLCLGKAKQAFIQEGLQEYLKRIKPHLKLELEEINTDKFAALPVPKRKLKEAELLLQKLDASDILILLDENGDKIDSSQLAKFMQSEMNKGSANICFAIGGVDGWDPGLPKKARRMISLSPLTFTSQMARLILIEQLYRVLCIIKGMPYHR